jgi:hypothetical protein
MGGVWVGVFIAYRLMDLELKTESAKQVSCSYIPINERKSKTLSRLTSRRAQYAASHIMIYS